MHVGSLWVPVLAQHLRRLILQTKRQRRDPGQAAGPGWGSGRGPSLPPANPFADSAAAVENLQWQVRHCWFFEAVAWPGTTVCGFLLALPCLSGLLLHAISWRMVLHSRWMGHINIDAMSAPRATTWAAMHARHAPGAGR